MFELRRWTVVTFVALAACGDDVSGPPPITRIVIAAPSDVLVVGRQLAFDIRAFTDRGNVPAPDPVWSSSDPMIATVSPDGVVSGIGAGAARITASAGSHEASLDIRVAPDSLPVFHSPPFEGEYYLWNPFDHDLPRWSGSAGQILTWRGYNVPGLEGHNGYDWAMPEGTPLFATGDGMVNFAGAEQPWSCPLRGNQQVSALYVLIQHTGPTGERFLSRYIHLSRLDVETGQTVVAGQQIGLSGNTGCSTGPHLHFDVFRESYARQPLNRSATITDPNGWEGQQDDPWLLTSDGAASSYLWAPGASPPFPPPPATVPIGPLDALRDHVIELPVDTTAFRFLDGRR